MIELMLLIVLAVASIGALLFLASSEKPPDKKRIG